MQRARDKSFPQGIMHGCLCAYFISFVESPLKPVACTSFDCQAEIARKLIAAAQMAAKVTGTNRPNA